MNAQTDGMIAASLAHPPPTESHTAEAVRPSRPWVTVFVMQFLYVVAMVDRNLVALLVTPIKKSLGISDFQVSLLQGTAFGLFFVLCGLFSGWLLDRFSRRKVVYWGVTVWSVCAASCGLAANYLQLMLGRFGVGAGEAVLSPASYAMISTQFPKEKLGFAIGVWGTGSVIGGSVSLWLGGLVAGILTEKGPTTLPLIGFVEPWQQTFLLFGLPGLVLAPLVFLIHRSADHAAGHANASSLTPLRPFLRPRAKYLTLHFLAFGLVTLLAYGQSAWMPTFLLREFGLEMPVIGRMVALSGGIGGIAGFMIAGRTADRWLARGMEDAHYRYALGAVVLLTIGGIASTAFASPLVCVVLTGACYFMTTVTGLAVVHLQITTPVALRARVSALYLVVVNVIGLCCGPSVVAGFTDFLYRDPARVGSSIQLTFAIFGPLAVAMLWFGRPHALAALRAGASGPR
ncbi:MFS transporter [soil metagenome]